MTSRSSKHYTLIDTGSSKADLSTNILTSYSALQQTDKVLLGSGFSSLAPDTSYPLSAALQLNGDCTDMNTESVADFARAELEKSYRVSFRSYDVDADFRVCVVADELDKLNTFVDTYSGILEIEPILIKRNHPEFSTAVELTISRLSKGLAIEYTIRSPINVSKCNYCGACGLICPEQCIAETLYFDFSMCTFCMECQKQCPVEAIDMYGIERISLEIPALIILGDPTIELPDGSGSIYKEHEISSYLATLYSCKVDEVITCDAHICHFNGENLSGCKACVSACRYGAIRTDNKTISIDPFNCIECGECISVCPTGALHYHRCTDQSFIEFFRSFTLQSGSTIILGAEKELHRFWWLHHQKTIKNALFLEYPNTSGLSLMHLLFLYSHGAARIVVLSSADAANSSLVSSVKEANLFISKTSSMDEIVQICSPDDFSVSDDGKKEHTGFLEPLSDLNYIDRRRKLASITEHLTSTKDGPLNPVRLNNGEIRFFAIISCDEDKCTQCLACLNVCKIESLSADQGNLSLCWNGGLCIGCTACVATCPEQALSINNTVDLSSSFFSSQEVSHAEPMCCKSCGKVFGTKKSFERVIKILSERNQSPPEHLEYCEDCRVLKLMETE